MDIEKGKNHHSIEEIPNSPDFFSTYTSRGWYKSESEIEKSGNVEQLNSELDVFENTEDTQPIILAGIRTPPTVQQKFGVSRLVICLGILLI